MQNQACGSDEIRKLPSTQIFLLLKQILPVRTIRNTYTPVRRICVSHQGRTKTIYNHPYFYRASTCWFLNKNLGEQVSCDAGVFFASFFAEGNHQNVRDKVHSTIADTVQACIRNSSTVKAYNWQFS